MRNERKNSSAVQTMGTVRTSGSVVERSKRRNKKIAATQYSAQYIARAIQA